MISFDDAQPITAANPSLRVVQAILLLVVALGMGSCSEDELPRVWIQKVDPGAAAPSTVVHLFGRGLEAQTPLAADATAGVDTDQTTSASDTCETPTGLNAVTVGGVPASVCFRSDSRIDLVVPRLPAGAQHIVVFSGGVASNAEVLYLLEVTAAP